MIASAVVGLVVGPSMSLRHAAPMPLRHAAGAFRRMGTDAPQADTISIYCRHYDGQCLKGQNVAEMCLKQCLRRA